ncbi:MAG TPA: carbohydrate kinase family protein [Spirochaeta sp.]|nr:carbohydrate kinase family protein [Spirochaeta sp.]
MKVNATGCSLVDNLYSPVDFNSAGYKKWAAESGVKDGLITGGLIFGDDLERSSGVSFSEIIKEITEEKIIPNRNIGGPAIVALIHMSQILDMGGHSFRFYGSMADDQAGRFITEKLKQFRIDTSAYITTDGHTPFTDVLSDPSYNNNNGERSFINYIGAAGYLCRKNLPDSFFDADILIFGGTGLTPALHDDLSYLLKRGKENACRNFVNTVYDFRNQKKDPDKRWPLVTLDEDFKLIDLLITDNEEALRISGKTDKHAAVDFFRKRGVQSGIITHGAEDIICFSNGVIFSEKGTFKMPVSKEAGAAMQKAPADEADTTGCGDNFAGGVYASTTEQFENKPKLKPSLKQAVALGAVSGGFAGLYRGGVYYEKAEGEKLERLQQLLKAYEVQTRGIFK